MEHILFNSWKIKTDQPLNQQLHVSNQLILSFIASKLDLHSHLRWVHAFKSWESIVQIQQQRHVNNTLSGIKTATVSASEGNNNSKYHSLKLDSIQNDQVLENRIDERSHETSWEVLELTYRKQIPSYDCLKILQ